MTMQEINYAARNRVDVNLPDLLVPLTKPMQIVGIMKRFRSVEETVRRGKQWYYEVILRDPNGRGEIVAAPDAVKAVDAEKFTAMLARYTEFEARSRVDE